MKAILFLLSILVYYCEVFCRIEPLQTLVTVDKSRKFRASESLDTCFLTYAPCDPLSKYRTYDGSCNNLQHPTWGMVNSAFTRLFPARYSDGIELPPTATDGSELPDARFLVTQLLLNFDAPDIASLAVPQWAQFTAHDLGLPLFKTEIPDCCGSDNPIFCMSMRVPENDKFYSQYDVTCLPVTRTQTTVTGDCKLNGTKHQINGVTHPMDASQIYGSDEETANSIREHRGGRLSVRQDSKGRWFLPIGGDICYNAKHCYVGGSGRVNQTPQLTALTTLFVREHNRIADILSARHSDWNDETAYQEARRILIALYQHITYDHFMPNILPSAILVRLNLLSGNRYHKYDDTLPMMGITSFLNPTFRLFHSALQGSISFYDYHLNPVKEINLTDYMNSPDLLEEGDDFDELILGFLNEPMQIIDEFYTSEIQGKIYHYDKPYGSDLNALDVQRTRDLAIPSYPAVLYACRGIEIKTFDDLLDIWPANKVDKIRTLYKAVDDIDLFIGLVSETKHAGHRLSPLAECIMTEQFYRYKNGDRFWYEVQGEPHSFTQEQIDEINKFSLSHLICNNSDNITKITENSFLPPSSTNSIFPCSYLSAVDFSKF